jgi:DNA polymerase-1
MVDAFNRNLDLHLLTANSAFGLGLGDNDFINGTDAHSVAKRDNAAARDRGKNGINFPIVYGTSAFGISHRQSVSKKVAQQWIDSFFSLYAGVKPAMEATTEFLRKNGYVRTMMGRKRRLKYTRWLTPLEKGRMERQAFNFKIQGFSADQMKIAAVRAYRAGLKPLMIVHDEFVCEVPEGTSSYSMTVLEGCMVNAVSLSVPFEVEINSGKNYAEIK